MTLKGLLLIIAFVLLFGGMIYYAYHLKKLAKEEQDDFENARTDASDDLKNNTDES